MAEVAPVSFPDAAQEGGLKVLCEMLARNTPGQAKAFVRGDTGKKSAWAWATLRRKVRHRHGCDMLPRGVTVQLAISLRTCGVTRFKKKF